MTATDSKINQLFNSLDAWRNLPAYQLERRADIFFSLYLAEALKKKFDLSEEPILIPEFPVRYGLIPDAKGTAGENQSFKIDYLAVTKNERRIFFIELKTDMCSRNEKQDSNMGLAAKVEGHQLFVDIEKMHNKSNAKHKYLALYSYLHEQLHTNERPLKMVADGKAKGVISGTDFEQFFEGLNKIQSCIVYLQPNVVDAKEGEEYIDFLYFADVVEKHSDYISARFANSLRKWAASEAGMKP